MPYDIRPSIGEVFETNAIAFHSPMAGPTSMMITFAVGSNAHYQDVTEEFYMEFDSEDEESEKRM